MPIIRLSGGLGNQLFQVSLAIAISKQTGRSVDLDLSDYFYSGRLKNRFAEVELFESEHFNFFNRPDMLQKIQAKFLPNTILASLQISQNSKLANERETLGLPIQRERQMTFDAEINTSIDSYFVGNFISPQYWRLSTNFVLGEVRGLFWGEDVHVENRKSDTIAIHIRRGDYIANPKARSFHGICGGEYYRSSVESLLDQFHTITDIEVFSDDIDSVSEILQSLKVYNRKIRVNQSEDPMTVLKEMSAARYFIGSNSTFSWWSSVLNQNRISVLPSQWFLDPTRTIEHENFFIGNVQVSKIPLE